MASMALQLENLEKIRRDFHKYPELGFQEKRTKIKIANYLKGRGADNLSAPLIITEKKWQRPNKKLQVG